MQRFDDTIRLDNAGVRHRTRTVLPRRRRFQLNYRTFNLFGLYMYGRDQSQVLNEGRTGLMAAPAAHFSGGFLEADYLALPWLMTIMRYDREQSTGLSERQAGWQITSQLGERDAEPVTPGVQFLIHANIKASFEYQIRPQQVVYDSKHRQTDSTNPSDEFGGCGDWSGCTETAYINKTDLVKKEKS